MTILAFRGRTPTIAADAFIAPSADVIGDVEIGAEASVWFNCTVRGDVERIRIGARTNIQDGTVVHVSRHQGPALIGANITIGHQALIHACILEDGCFIGMGAVVMDHAVVEGGAMVAAGALVTPGKRIPKGELWAGRPARHKRDLSPEEIAGFEMSVGGYVALAREYR